MPTAERTARVMDKSASPAETALHAAGPAPRRIPLWVTLPYTAFVAVLVPVYWHAYGPTNFLYFCDVALLMTVPALWLECSLLASTALVGILLPQVLWQIDFLAAVCGVTLTGMTAYMFNDELPLFTRFLSFFHFWLPLFLLWVVCRLGYDRRALVVWTSLAWVIMLVCYFWMPPPAPDANPSLPVNINYVWGFSAKEPQPWLPTPAYLALLMIVLPAGIWWPTHWALSRLWGPRAHDAKG